MLIKRWAALFFLGIVLTGLALAMALVYAYRGWRVPEPIDGLVRALTLQFIPRELRFALVLLAGIACLGYGFWRLTQSFVTPLMATSEPGRQLAQIVADHRFGPNRPVFKVVAIGGGTGLSNLLRGLKRHDVAITAIVTVADDGGSTGRIRSEFDIPAPGDIRNCLVALADDESLVGRLFQYRFDQEGSQLAGHSFGNLFITALTRVTGSFEQAVSETASVLAIRGRVLPSTLANVSLSAELIDGTVMHGESSIAHKQAPIKRVFLEPGNPTAYEPALSAILNADLIVLGPGSLYTSVLPNLLVDGLTQAIRWSPATVVYACNVATQPGETDHFGAVDHIRAIVDHVGERFLDVALVNSNPASAAAIQPELPIEPVTPTGLERLGPGIRIVSRDLVSDKNPLRHDPDKLATALLELAEAGITAEIQTRLAPPQARAPQRATGAGKELVATASAKE
ncbi:MAG: YvcK family protein [Chloroflexota bacterium]|nr:YvcK family protein [Chloroflexota bacterium]